MNPNPIDVCVCVRNPERGLLGRVLEAIAGQSVGAAAYHVIVVDNGSSPALTATDLMPLTARGVRTHLQREPRVGLQHARLAAVAQSRGEWLVWVDSDNELAPDYLANGIAFVDDHPATGCFGGRLLLPPGVEPKPWMRPFLPYLGVREGGDTVLITCQSGWTPAEPPGAGAWVHRAVVEEYARYSRRPADFFALGRAGSHGLASCDDSLMMRCGYRVGMACAYAPTLRLYHHVDLVQRTRAWYLVRLMYAYGGSHVVLEHLLGREQGIVRYRQARSDEPHPLQRALRRGIRPSVAFSIGMAAYYLGSRLRYLGYQTRRCMPRRKDSLA